MQHTDMKHRIIYIIAAIVAAMLATGCSTTKRLGKDDILYTGLKGVDIETPDGEKFPREWPRRSRMPSRSSLTTLC